MSARACLDFGEILTTKRTNFALPLLPKADGVLQIKMLKVNRRGHYTTGSTNADTWWRSLLLKAGPKEVISRQCPPTR